MVRRRRRTEQTYSSISGRCIPVFVQSTAIILILNQGCVCVSLYACVSLCLPQCLSACPTLLCPSLSISLSGSLSVSMSQSHCMSLSLSLSRCLCLCLSLCLSPSVCIYMYLSVCVSLSLSLTHSHTNCKPGLSIFSNRPPLLYKRPALFDRSYWSSLSSPKLRICLSSAHIKRRESAYKLRCCSRDEDVMLF